MHNCDYVLEKLHKMAELSGADLAWIAEVAHANGAVCFSRLWVTPSYHPAARGLRALEGHPIPRVEQVLRPNGRALDDFARDDAKLTGSADAVFHLHCRGLEVKARLGLVFSRGTMSVRTRREVLSHLPDLLSAVPKLPELPDGCLSLLYGADGKLLYFGGESKDMACWQPAIDQVGRIIQRGGPAIVGNIAVTVQPLVGPQDTDTAYLVSLQAARSVSLSPHVLLTPSQREVAISAARGATVREIASELGRHNETVRSHLREAYRRLDVASRIDLARTLLGEMTSSGELQNVAR